MTTPHYQDADVTVYHGDCIEVLKGLPDASIDAVVTDPPYGIAFMGKAWDQPGVYGSTRKNGTPGKAHRKDNDGAGAMTAGTYDLSTEAMRNFQRWCEAWARECHRVLKPGGHILAFGGSRTWHRLATGIEDAGFEIRDSIAWLYAQGFPKSVDVSKAIDKATHLTRERLVAERTGIAWEDYVKRGVKTMKSPATVYADQVTHVVDHGEPQSEEAQRWTGWGTALKPAFDPVVVGRKPLDGTVAANILAHGVGALNVDGCRVGTSAGTRQAGDQRVKIALRDGTDGKSIVESIDAGRWPPNVIIDPDVARELDRFGSDDEGLGRMFPTFRYEPKAPTSERPRDGDTAHPTVKPLDLMRWMVRLVVPTGGVVLDPFGGSGTTAEACVIENIRCITIERETEYLPLIVGRLTKPIQTTLDL